MPVRALSITSNVGYILDLNAELYHSFPSLVVGQIEEEDSTWVTRESEDIKWGGNRGIPTCVGAAGYQRGWESIAMCVNLNETMLWRCGEGGGSWWKCGKWSRLELGGLGSFGCRKIYLEATLLRRVELKGCCFKKTIYWWALELSQYNVQRWVCRCDLLVIAVEVNIPCHLSIKCVDYLCIVLAMGWRWLYENECLEWCWAEVSIGKRAR